MLPDTISDQKIISPLAQTLNERALVDFKEFAALKDGVSLGDLSGTGLLDIRGDEAEKMLGKIYKDMPKKIGAAARVSDGILARLRDDQFALIFLGEDFAATAENLAGAAGKSKSLITVTDLTHGRGHFLLCGENAADILPKICGLDFSERVFPDGSAAQTSLAKVRTLIIRQDNENMPCYHLVMGQSLAAYTWEVVFDAAQEFDGKAIKISSSDFT